MKRKHAKTGSRAPGVHGPHKPKRPRDESSPQPSRGGAARPWLLPTFLLLAAIVGVVYGNALGNRFVFDDANLIGLDRRVRDAWDLLPKDWRGTWWLGYRPLRTASYALDYALFRLDPLGYHLSNLLYHTLSGFVAYLIVFRLLRQHLPALFVAILFLVHPVQTDAVTYLSGRRDVLFGLFYLLGFFAFLRYRDTGLRRYSGLAVFSYVLSLASKEMAVTLPLLCLAYDLMWSDSVPGPRRPLWAGLWQRVKTVYRRDPFFYAAMGVFALAFILQFGFLYRPTRRLTYYGGSFALTMLTVARIIVHYLTLLVYPRTLNADYSYNAFPITSRLADLPSLAAVLFLVLLIALLLRLAQAHRVLAFGGLWFFLTLLPVTHIIPHHELMAEHYLYIPSFGIFLAVGSALEETLLRKQASPRVLYPLMILVALLLSLRTMVRNRDWKDDLTLWKKTVETAPMAARARANLGKAYLRRDMDTLGERELEEAVRIKPDVATYHDDLGLAYLRLGRLAEAERELTEALRQDGRLVSANVNLAFTYINQGRKPEAVPPLVRALELRPGDQTAMAQLALLYMELGRLDEAERTLTQLSRFRPKDPKVYVALATVYQRKRNVALAEAALEKAVQFGGEIPEVRDVRRQIEQEKRDGQRRPAH